MSKSILLFFAVLIALIAAVSVGQGTSLSWNGVKFWQWASSVPKATILPDLIEEESCSCKVTSYESIFIIRHSIRSDVDQVGSICNIVLQQLFIN